ncbi:MAG: hypothetical protein AAB770_00810 [Patescibacteria group bacterium]
MSKHNTNRNRGAAIITAVMFFVVITVAIAVGISSPVVREYKTSRDFEKSKGAYYLSEAGHEDALYRLKEGTTIGAQEVISLGGNVATTTITNIGGGKSIGSIGDILTNTRRVKSMLTTSSGISFNYGVQAGDGGVLMDNTASITGNLYSRGPVCGGGQTGTDCLNGVAAGDNSISGTVYVATTTSNGVITNITNQLSGTASMYANKIYSSFIASSTVTCNTISGSNRSSCTYPLGTQTPLAFPISDTQVLEWEAAAEAGGVATAAECPGGKYSINSTVTLGPIKIPCDLEISGTAKVNLMGPVWVTTGLGGTANISIKNSTEINVDPSLGAQSVAIIADPGSATRATGGSIALENNITFNQAAGSNANAYVLLLSWNTGASLGTSAEAIEVNNSVLGNLLVYAGYGDIKIENNASLREVTGYKITLKNSANVIYSAGLENTLFTSGPGGSWVISDWKEGQ